ncbi:peptidoglycan DD-metalloendopeptidase family protein [Paenibacillus chartarius]|uniref:Peptidoglycan DD-metalloendopeptidase family protein n=1 Tax=Paenibacillus chartarius TaxID=747481 RepID=A0ABV6DID9_9BACL
MKKTSMFSLALTATLLMGNMVSAETYTSYTVQRGETLWMVSQKLNRSLAGLLAANPQVNPNNVYEGLKINIPAAETPKADVLTNTTASAYTVQPGDHFWLISQKFNVNWSRLVAANPTVNPSNMFVGQKINIPAESTMSVTTVQAPAYLADGKFPLKPGTYNPFVNTYGDGRSYNSDGTQQRLHEGNDMMAAKGTPVYSAYDGTVINKGWSTLGGWRLTVKTPDGKTALYYAHMSAYAANIELGSFIKKGQLIGYVGNTGYGTEGTEGAFDPHLHFGMYDLTNGFKPVDPYNHLKYWERTSLTASY